MPEKKYDKLKRVVEKGDYTLGNKVNEFENKISKLLDAKYVVALGSGTDALMLSLKALGIREGDNECLEAVDSFGATSWQRVTRVQMPLALPTIFAGVNQTIMMALAMVVIASMIGVKGLGVPVLRAVSNQYLALGMLNGLAIVALAIIFDRVSQQYGKRLQKHREGRNL